MTETSKAAMRAARELFIEEHECGDEWNTEAAAEVIDRETGLPELLEIVSLLQSLINFGVDDFTPEFRQKIDNALRKAGEL